MQCALECARLPIAEEAFVSASEEASPSGRSEGGTQNLEGGDADEPNGRLEWVVKRAHDSKYESTAEFKADVERTWDFLEKKWTSEGRASRLDAVRAVREHFDSKWLSRGIGDHGGLVCMTSVGISPDAINLPKSSSLYSLDSLVERTGDIADRTNIGARLADATTAKDDVKAGADEDARMQTLLALDRCVDVVQNFMKQPEATSFLHCIDSNSPDYPNYSLVIKQPMDLTSVHERLLSKSFTSPRQVWDACNLIWSNFRLYNGQSSKLNRLCDQAELMFTAAWRAEGLDSFIDDSDNGSCEAPWQTDELAPKKLTENMRSSSSSATSMKVSERVASFKCDVCKRSKKGRCGTVSAPKSCLERPENQTEERQAQIRERVSKLKPLESKGPRSSKNTTIQGQLNTISTTTTTTTGRRKRKISEAEQQESCFRRVFDENDPDNFISHILRHQNSEGAPVDYPWTNSSFVANEQLRLELMMNQQSMQYEDRMQSADSAELGAKQAASMEALRRSIDTTRSLLQDRNIKLHLCNMAMSQKANDKHEVYARERLTLEGQIRELHKRHQEQSAALHRLAMASGTVNQKPPALGAPPANFTPAFDLNAPDRFISIATVLDVEPGRVKDDAPAARLDVDDVLLDFPSSA